MRVAVVERLYVIRTINPMTGATKRCEAVNVLACGHRVELKPHGKRGGAGGKLRPGQITRNCRRPHP